MYTSVDFLVRNLDIVARDKSGNALLDICGGIVNFALMSMHDYIYYQKSIFNLKTNRISE